MFNHKGDQYDVRESTEAGRGEVRNLGLPVDLCETYYLDGKVIFHFFLAHHTH